MRLANNVSNLVRASSIDFILPSNSVLKPFSSWSVLICVIGEGTSQPIKCLNQKKTLLDPTFDSLQKNKHINHSFINSRFNPFLFSASLDCHERISVILALHWAMLPVIFLLNVFVSFLGPLGGLPSAGGPPDPCCSASGAAPAPKPKFGAMACLAPQLVAMQGMVVGWHRCLMQRSILNN